MPPVSEKQRRAMQAAASGKGTIGIPPSVGKDFATADPGGKLPPSAASPTKKESLKPKMGKPDAKKGLQGLINRSKPK